MGGPSFGDVQRHEHQDEEKKHVRIEIGHNLAIRSSLTRRQSRFDALFGEFFGRAGRFVRFARKRRVGVGSSSRYISLRSGMRSTVVDGYISGSFRNFAIGTPAAGGDADRRDGRERQGLEQFPEAQIPLRSGRDRGSDLRGRDFITVLFCSIGARPRKPEACSFRHVTLVGQLAALAQQLQSDPVRILVIAPGLLRAAAAFYFWVSHVSNFWNRSFTTSPISGDTITSPACNRSLGGCHLMVFSCW